MIYILVYLFTEKFAEIGENCWKECIRLLAENRCVKKEIEHLLLGLKK